MNQESFKWGDTLSVKLIDNEAFYGYRVRRTVDGKLFQEYFSLKKDSKRMGPSLKTKVAAEAKKRDAVLEDKQKKAKVARKAERCFHDDGSVKGISFLKKKEKSGRERGLKNIQKNLKIQTFDLNSLQAQKSRNMCG